MIKKIVQVLGRVFNLSIDRSGEKRMAMILRKPYGELSSEEKLELALDKYFKNERISYDEFKMICSANMEPDFCYRGKCYEIINGSKGDEKDFFFDTNYIGEGKNCKCTWEKEENYSSIEELLDKVRIDGKPIKEIWDKVEYPPQ